MQKLAFFFLSFIKIIDAFIWPLDIVLHGDRTSSISQGYMFATNDGPVGTEFFTANQASFIAFEGFVTIYARINASVDVKFAVYEWDDMAGPLGELEGVCNALSIEDLNPNARRIQRYTATPQYIGTVNISDASLNYLNTTRTDDDYTAATNDDLSGNTAIGSSTRPLTAMHIASDQSVFYEWRAPLAADYIVKSEGLYAIAFQVPLLHAINNHISYE